ncbi:AAA family ATPase [Georgenia satyanarayanai]|uniref:ATP-binding protein n=1 Tax=Georgenia satyanarayanai TaxID=860221 RepID=UPI00203BA518|nr:LuxR family transcriptional regulator [Georgenia satyanarayanai]MCM3661514.1 AAA family ATPase [Georgenia satyanarayanai]
MGRRAERDTVEQLLALARSGRSGTLVVRGEAGIGKTALLEHARNAAGAAFRVETLVGVEAEAQFAFAGLHQLCAPLLSRADALPAPQHSALAVAFGQRAGAAPDRFLVGLATLNLIAEAAEERPILCLVDDAQWLDEASAQVLAFVARRLVAERVAMAFAVRDGPVVRAFAGLPELRLGALSEEEARTLLSAGVHAPLDDGVRDRIIAESRGNPLALVELPLGAPPARLAGGFELPDPASVPHRVEESFRRRSSGLPPATQQLLLVAAAEPTGEVALLWRAAAHLGIAADAAAPAEAAGLLEIDSRVRFRHPLARSAVYGVASPADRRRAHRALASATDPSRDPDRLAWHRARAVLGVDEEVAGEVERLATRARDRGGLAAAAAFLQEAAELSSEPVQRARRALEAAEAKHRAGASEAALSLLGVAAAGPLDVSERARVELLRAHVAFHLRRDPEVPGMLLHAARMLAPLEPALSRETHLHALDAAILNGGDAVGIAEAVRTAPASESPARPVDLLLDGLATALTQGYASGVPQLRHALEAFRDGAYTGPEPDRHDDAWLWLAGRTAVGLLDDELVHALATRNVQRARTAGALATLPTALNLLSITSVLMGRLGRATELAAEAATITQATGGVQLPHAQVILGAWRGDEAATTALTASTAQDSTHPDGSTDAAQAQYALAVLHNGLGNYPAAQEAATSACRSPELALRSSSIPEYVEACARAGTPELAASAVDQLGSRAEASGTRWALGTAACARALTSTGPRAEDLYLEAIEHLESSLMGAYTARAHLVYGEWLRREGRRKDAREQLRTAHGSLSAMGAEAFAARAARELQATGEHPRKRSVQPADTLTPHELHIARLVATGATSREVGAQLFLSPRTIEAHLRSIFAKLGITSRRQLREVSLP